MVRKGWAASAALLCVIVIFTILAAGYRPKPVLIGDFAEFLIPALLTIYLLVLLYSARAIMELLASFLLGNRQRDDSRGRSWMVVIGYAVGTILIILLVRSAALANLLGVVEKAVAATSAALTAGQSLPAQRTVSAASRYVFYYIVLIFVAIVVASFSLLIGGVHTAYRWVREERFPVDREKLRLETLQVVQRAAKDLIATDDYRGTILNCYREMCNVLSVHGFHTELHETASEFSRAVSAKLGLGGESVRGLTLLFEEARYSDHAMGNAKRAEALNQLESLERSLGAVSS
jgi:uncharacterized membrane protein